MTDVRHAIYLQAVDLSEIHDITVSEAKKQILGELKKVYNMSVPDLADALYISYNAAQVLKDSKRI